MKIIQTVTCIMKTTDFLVPFAACLCLAISPLLRAKDEVRVVLTSKIDAAKLHLREKSATPWMTEADLKKLNETKRGQNQQLIYFEYHSALGKWRAVYTDKLLLAGFSWWIYYGQNEMEAKVNEEMKKGLKPAFIARSGNGYAMLFVKPEQFDQARAILDELGIGEPRLKK